MPQTYLSCIYDGGNIFQGTVFWKRDIFYKYGMIDKKLQTAMEYKLFDNFFKNEKGYFLNDILAAYRLHKKAKSYQIPNEIKLAELNNIRKIKSNIILKNYYKFRRIFYYFIFSNLLNSINEKLKTIF